MNREDNTTVSCSILEMSAWSCISVYVKDLSSDNIFYGNLALFVCSGQFYIPQKFAYNILCDFSLSLIENKV